MSTSAPFDSVFLRDQGNLISGTDLKMDPGASSVNQHVLVKCGKKKKK